ncbi:carbohydrate ABC transporter permease [uncultured Eubacterium sp.]|uniref:carbohydrate ABC transporter permease n=1 Tax=Eubacterium sp. TaxID=142586 RepID=UPI002672F4BC|nr:sugar ABC transporter permease [uncultured Eubacterium sp.]
MDARIYKNKKIIIFFLIPAFIFMLVFLYYPFVRNIINSFQHIKYMGTASGEWNNPVFKNFINIFKDPKMSLALKNTGIMIVATIVGEVGIALILALLVSNIKKGSGFFRVVYFFPIVVSATALGLLFNLIFLYDKGMINQFLQFIGVLDASKNQLIDWKASHSIMTMLIPVVWQYVGFYFVILLTGLSGIPMDLYEAAAIDGASKLQRVRYITIPLLRNSICTCVVLAVTGALKVFDLPWTMFPGGMADTWLTGTYMYSNVYSDVDYASAIGVVIVLIGVVLSFVVNRLFKTKSDYEA